MGLGLLLVAAWGWYHVEDGAPWRRSRDIGVTAAASHQEDTDADRKIGAPLVTAASITPDTPHPALLESQPQYPLPVAWEGRRFQWAAGDCMEPDILRRLARHEREYERMWEENRRIQRRQLVYIKEPAALLAQRTRVHGHAGQRLLVPGLDGKELEVEIERVDLEPSGQAGVFIGRLVDHPDSLVTLAFESCREAFTVLAPSAGLYLQGHPRQSCEMFVTSFDLDLYLPLPCGGPILTTP